VVANFAQKFSVGGELEELRGCGAIGGTDGIAAREDEDVAFGIHGDAGSFTEMEVGWTVSGSRGRSGNGFRAFVGQNGSNHEKKTREFLAATDSPHNARYAGISRLHMKLFRFFFSWLLRFCPTNARNPFHSVPDFLKLPPDSISVKLPASP